MEYFRAYLMKQYRFRTAKQRFSYAQKFYRCLINRDFNELTVLSDDKRVHVLKSLSALAKFLGMYEDFRVLVKNYGLKWSGRNSDDLIIERLTKVSNPNEVFEWVKKVKQAIPELRDFMDFIGISGLRFIEAINSYNLIIDLAKEGRLSEYYNGEREVLEHFRFKELFIRNSKRAFISFIPKTLIETIVRNKPLNMDSVQTKVKRKLSLRFSDVREAHGTFLTKYLRESEIDFLHGRVSASVFMRNYFNPALITDLKERVFKGIDDLKKLV
jgi:intergrase/recombinase